MCLQRAELCGAGRVERGIARADGTNFPTGKLHLRDEFRLALQAAEGRGTDQAACFDIALPMHAADDAAFAKGEAAPQQSIAALWREVRQASVPRSSRWRNGWRVGIRLVFFGRRATAVAMRKIRALALVGIFGGVAGERRIGPQTAEQRLDMRGFGT